MQGQKGNEILHGDHGWVTPVDSGAEDGLR
jgi:hypothetical protein